VRSFELADHCDTVRAHDDVNGALGHLVDEAVRAERDRPDGGVLDEHRDDDVAAFRYFTDCGGDARARGGERLRLRGELIEHGHFVARAEKTPGHPLAHAAEADESDFHAKPLRAKR
jgi:hypothetical protein